MTFKDFFLGRVSCDTCGKLFCRDEVTAREWYTWAGDGKDYTCKVCEVVKCLEGKEEVPGTPGWRSCGMI